MTSKFDFTTFSDSADARLLIIDDVPENIGVLFNLLSEQGHEVLIAEDGQSGIETAHIEQPDLILLDVMMPQIDGFEVCRRLKTDSATEAIPIIFLTALNETHSKVTGFQLGAVDYITKPLQHDEVLARVDTHLTVRRLQRQQQQFIEQLQDSNAELDAFAHTVAHDLKNPLGLVTGLSEMLCRQYTEDAHLLDKVRDIRNAGYKMREIIDALLLLAKVSKQQIETVAMDMNAIVQQALQRVQPELQARAAELHLPQVFPVALGQAQWIEEVWTNYLSNALKYGGHPPRLEIGAQAEGEQVLFWVQDNGAGLSSEAQQKVFTPFTRLHQNLGEEGHGLGLSIVERIVSKLGGQVGIVSEEGRGSRFFFTLPKAEAMQPQTVQPVGFAPRLFAARTRIGRHCPAPEHLKHLREAVLQGDMELLEERLQPFAQQPEFSGFFQEISELAQNMRVKALRTALEHYIEQTKPSRTN